MQKMKLTFERGGELTISFNGLAPETERCIKEALPLESDLKHSRYSGREVCFGFETNKPAPKENSKSTVEKGNVVYWRDWDATVEKSGSGSIGTEVIGLYYGHEVVQFQGNNLFANVFGQVDKNQDAMLEEIGIRIWQKGFERVRAELIEE